MKCDMKMPAKGKAKPTKGKKSPGDAKMPAFLMKGKAPKKGKK